MQRTRIKICGLKSPDAALDAVHAGADAIGLNFYSPSARAVSVDRAREIVDVIPPFINVVALFVDPDLELVREVESKIGPNLLQFHGSESDQFASQFDTPYIKALGVSADHMVNIEASIETFPGARGFLLDTMVKGVSGGTGKTFDWSLIPQSLASKIILAGGLNPDNVADAVTRVRPYAVDVSGGVESSPGEKDADKMARFVAQVQVADGLVR